MQKIYQRINWENDPSTNTPINEDNLNKMDYALDQIDNRVVQLSGYQDRVAQSESNAKKHADDSKTYSENSKASEDKAKQSELKAKEYMENAFKGTPEGYSALVEQVGLLDIAKSTGNTLYNSKKGGYRLNDLVGNTVQNGEPSQSTPIAIENTFDCVEMKLGYWSGNGYANSTEYVCNKIPIPCVAGNNVKIIYDKISTLGFAFYDANMNCITSMLYAENVKEYSATAPTNTKYVCYNVKVRSGITPQTVGKISLTVNGKYVGQIVEHGKNRFNPNSNERTKSAYIQTDGSTKYDSTGFVTEYICVKGMSNVTISGRNNPFESPCVAFYDKNKNLIKTYAHNKNVLETFVVPTNAVYMRESVSNNDVNTLQIEEGTATTYEPYTEKVTTFFLNEPLREGDRLVKVGGVWRVERHIVEFDLGDVQWSRGVFVGASTTLFATAGIDNFLAKTYDINTAPPNAYCEMFLPKTTNQLANGIGNNGFSLYAPNKSLYIQCDEITDVTTFKETVRGVKMQCELTTPTYETLDTASQLALNDMVTFDGVTYIEVDSKIPPTSISGEYGTSRVGAYTLKCMNDNDTDKIERADMKTQIETLRNMILSLGGNV